MTSFESNEINAVEVDNVKFEIIVPQRMLCLPKKNLLQKFLSILDFLATLESVFAILPGHFSPKHSVEISIRITNKTSIPFRFSFFILNLFIELIDAQGAIPLECGWIRLPTPVESDYPLLMPGESLIFFPKIQIFKIWGNRFGLSITNRDNSTCVFQPLKPGNFQLRFIYYNPDEKVTIYSSESRGMELIEDIWTGEVLTPFVELNLAPL